MTTVRGKDPVKLVHLAEVKPLGYSLQIELLVRARDSTGTYFDAVAMLGPECASQLILKVRKALRDVRSESAARLDNAVNKAEGQV